MIGRVLRRIAAWLRRGLHRLRWWWRDRPVPPWLEDPDEAADVRARRLRILRVMRERLREARQSPADRADRVERVQARRPRGSWW